MPEQFVLAIDQGTTSSRAILFNKHGRPCHVAQKEFKQYYPHPGWVEQDPREILSSQIGVIAEVTATAQISLDDIVCAGITNQRETTIVWDKNTGEPVYNAIVWQCRRTADIAEDLIAKGYKELIHNKTGLTPDAYFSGTKIQWILDNVEGARQKAEAGDLLFGTVDTWLIWNLTAHKVHVTDYTNASRTMLFNIHTRQWDEELLELLNIPASMLPEVRPSSGDFGVIEHQSLGGNIPITGDAGDQQAALFGQCCFEPGQAKNTYGTGCFMLMNTGDKAIESKSGLVTTIAASGTRNEDGTFVPHYALEGSVFVAGALMQWLRDGLRVLDNVADSSDIASALDSSEGVYIVPALTGLGAPYWDSYARGSIYGITRGTTREHIIRAALEALAYSSYDILNAMEEDAGFPLTRLQVDGGASNNDFLMQFQADILNTTVVRPQTAETTALGAAYLAGLSVGYWSSEEEIRENCEISATYKPKMTEEKRTELLKGWKKAIERTIS